MIMSSFIFTIYFFFFFFNDTAPTEIYPLSLPDALPFSRHQRVLGPCDARLIEKNIRPLELALECVRVADGDIGPEPLDRKSTRLNSSHSQISYAVFCLKKKNKYNTSPRCKSYQIAASTT